MKVACPSCQTNLNVDEKKIPSGGARIRCPSCKDIFPVRPGDVAAPRPATTSGAVPLPGTSGLSPGIPLPGAVGASAPSTERIPLPGSSDFDIPDDWDKVPTRVGPVPAELTVPSGPASAAIPLPGSTAAASPGARSSQSGVVPLPGAAPLTSSGVRSSQSGVVPLPGAAPLTSSGVRSSQSGVVPLPGAAPLTSSGVRAAHFDGGGVNFDDFAAPNETLTEDDPFSQPAPPKFGFSALESVSPSDLLTGPSGAAAAVPAAEESDFSFGAPAVPQRGSSPGFAPPFDAPPMSAVPTGFDFDAGPKDGGSAVFDFGPPPEAAPPQYGEFDLQNDAREFVPPQHQGDDSLEADLSQSLPPPSSESQMQGADGLEMLRFVDEAASASQISAQPAGQLRRFHVRRRSGKVFGPFEEAVIVKMLEEGQLLGNEDVSLDSEQWQPLSSMAEFAGKAPPKEGVIAAERKSSLPSQTGAARPVPVVNASASSGASMEKLKALYDGRMAAVAVVEGKESVSFKKRIPLIAGGAALAAVLAAGIGIGLTTPYGYFGIKKLFPAKIKTDTREFVYLQQARQGLLQGTYKGHTDALALSAQTLSIKEYPEARAVWMQAAFALQRKYAQSKPEFQTAPGYFGDLAVLGETHPELLKAKVQEALLAKNADGALAAVDQALANERNQNDLELNFLRAEAYLAKKQSGPAQTEYEAVVKKQPQNARALSALGSLLRQQNKVDDSIAKYEEAFKADPKHVAAGVELAELLILEKKLPAPAKEALDQVLADGVKANLSPFEHGKALALQGELLVAEQKLTAAVPLFEEALKVDKTNPFAKVRLGSAYLALSKPEQALPLLKDAVTANADRLDYTEKYLATLIALGKMDEANTTVQSANARFPGNARIAYFSGRVADALDKAKEAEDAFKRSLAADPTNVDAHLHLARLYMRFRRFAEAKPELEKGIEKAPNSAGLRVGMGELALFERDFPRADKEFKKSIELDSNLADGPLGLSRVALEQQKYELALVQIDRALELNPRIAGGRLQRGAVLWKLGRLDESLRELDQAKIDEPRNVQATVTQGAVAFEKGDFPKALDALTQALSSNPSHPDANFFMGRLKNAKQEHTQAIESMRRAIDFNGKSPLYHYWMGRLYQDARKIGEAVEEWKTALQLDSKYADAHEAMGKMYFDQGQQAKAIAEFEQVLAVEPSRNAVRALIGDALMKNENWDKAIGSYAEALAADPDLKTVYAKLALAYEEKKNYAKAIEWYTKSTEREPGNAEPWRQLGWMYKESKRKVEAMAAFSKYLELKPNADDRKEISDEVYYLKQER
jgi:cellulose synthase operon protein C